mmetsp:Transcript_42992/g.71437  ORF Transcript_42992/g.71437 Transcript_42992/m.71437 type:complete len:241 (-) Transcript_42992:73-795(-)
MFSATEEALEVGEDTHMCKETQVDEVHDGKSSVDSMEHIASIFSELLTAIGEDPNREGLIGTPMRAAKALWFMTSGYRTRASDAAGTALFQVNPRQQQQQQQQPVTPGLVVLKDITVHSTCEHHLLPFFGKAHIGYLPGEAVLGLSKLARITNFCARRLQMQERLTEQIVCELMNVAQPRGVLVVLDCAHLCMCSRGVQQNGAVTRTSAMSGLFVQDASLRDEFFRHIANSNPSAAMSRL